MAVKAEVVSELDLFLTRAIGKLTDQDLFLYQETITKFPEYRPTLNTLFDGRSVTENLVSSESLIRISSRTPFDALVKRAYVVSNEKAGMYATLFGSTASASEHFFVTYNIEDACTWLGFTHKDIMNLSVYQDDE